MPKWLIGDRAYDSDPLDHELARRNIEMIAPHKSNRRQRTTQDGRPLRRFKRRWVVERFFAWIQNYRRIVVRYEQHIENFIGFVQLATAVILMKKYF
jgi:transposase